LCEIRKQKNQSFPTKKEREGLRSFVLRLHQSCSNLARAPRDENESFVGRAADEVCFPMKYCPNYQCVAYGRVVYSQSTRCAFCRWDLKPPRMKSEAAADYPRDPNAEEVFSGESATSRALHVRDLSKLPQAS
jgi:hypothetical protein